MYPIIVPYREGFGAVSCSLGMGPWRMSAPVGSQGCFQVRLAGLAYLYGCWAGLGWASYAPVRYAILPLSGLPL